MSLGSDTSEYRALELSYWRGADGSIEGNLNVHVWQDFQGGFSDHPALRWRLP